MIHFALLFSRQGKVRLSKYYVPYSQKERGKLVKEVTASILSRPAKLCNVVEHRQLKLVYKRHSTPPRSQWTRPKGPLSSKSRPHQQRPK